MNTCTYTLTIGTDRYECAATDTPANDEAVRHAQGVIDRMPEDATHDDCMRHVSACFAFLTA